MSNYLIELVIEGMLEGRLFQSYYFLDFTCGNLKLRPWNHPCAISKLHNLSFVTNHFHDLKVSVLSSSAVAGGFESR